MLIGSAHNVRPDDITANEGFYRAHSMAYITQESKFSFVASSVPKCERVVNIGYLASVYKPPLQSGCFFAFE